MNSNPQGLLWWQLCYGATSSVSFINTFWHHWAILSTRDFPFSHSSEPLKRLDLKNRIPIDGWLIAGSSSSTFDTCIMAGEASCTSWQLCLHRCARPRESLSWKSSYCRCLFIFLCDCSSRLYLPFYCGSLCRLDEPCDIQCIEFQNSLSWENAHPSLTLWYQVNIFRNNLRLWK